MADSKAKLDEVRVALAKGLKTKGPKERFIQAMAACENHEAAMAYALDHAKLGDSWPSIPGWLSECKPNETLGGIKAYVRWVLEEQLSDNFPSAWKAGPTRAVALADHLQVVPLLSDFWRHTKFDAVQVLCVVAKVLDESSLGEMLESMRVAGLDVVATYSPQHESGMAQLDGPSLVKAVRAVSMLHGDDSWLAGDDKGKGLFHELCQTDDPMRLRHLLTATTQGLRRSSWGLTPLMRLVGQDRVEQVQVLLESGQLLLADIDQALSEGFDNSAAQLLRTYRCALVANEILRDSTFTPVPAL